MRKWPAVPAASAERSCQVPLLDLAPPEAAAIQSDGKVTVASTVPLSAPAQLTGGAAVLILRIALTPIVVSRTSRRALRTAVEYCMVMVSSAFHLRMKHGRPG